MAAGQGDRGEGLVVWAGPSWKLRVHSLLGPEGSHVEKGIVEHPGAVVLIPVLPARRVVLVRQWRATLGQTILELPAGTRGRREAWLDCAQRELREETGYRANNLTSLGEAWPAPGYSDEVMHFYLAAGLSADPLPPDFDEEITPVVMALDELVALAARGELRDAKTVVGVVRAAAYLDNHKRGGRDV